MFWNNNLDNDYHGPGALVDPGGPSEFGDPSESGSRSRSGGFGDPGCPGPGGSDEPAGPGGNSVLVGLLNSSSSHGPGSPVVDN